jgi:hypothetical protein
LPLLIFIAAIAALAWVTQYLPSRQTPPDGKPPVPAPRQLVLKFANPHRVADWEPERTKEEWERLKKEAKQQGKNPDEVPLPQPSPYGAEYEVLTTDGRQDGGHYDFDFENVNGESAAVGLDWKYCQCSSVYVCALDSVGWARYQQLKAKTDPITRSRQSAEDGLPWKRLDEKDPHGVVVPAGQHGVIRMFWEGVGRSEPKRENLTARIWVSPPGKYAERQVTPIGVFVAYVRPANFHPERLNLGSVGSQNPSVSEVLHCWSATRDLKVAASSADPCFEVLAKKLEKQEDLRKLTDELRAQGIWTRVRSAYRIEVTVHEQKPGRQLELGTFLRTPALEVWGNGERLQGLSIPTVRGRVQGDIKIGTFQDDGAITLRVKTNLLTRATGKIWVKRGVKLEYEGFTPKGLNLEVDTKNFLKKVDADSLPGWDALEIQLAVPAGLEPGPLPEDSAILLRIEGSTRRIRIPLIGSAGRG